MTTTACPWSAEAALSPLLAHTTGFFRTYVFWASQQTDAPLLYNMLAALGLLSAVFPTHWRISDVPGTGVNGNLYVLLTGRQGTDRKTTALDYAGGLLDEAVPRLRCEPPGSVQAFVDTFDPNKAGGKIQQCLLYEEYAEFLAQTQQGRGGNPLTAIKHTLLTIYDGKPIGSTTRKHGHSYCPNPRLTIMAAVNPILLSDHTDPSDHEGGLMSRHMIGYGHRERYYPDDRRLSAEVRLILDNNRKYLISFLKLAKEREAKSWGLFYGIEITAKYALAAFGRSIEETTPTGKRARVWGARSRAARQVVKVAALLAFGAGKGWDSKPWQIELPEIVAAIGIVTACYAGSIAIASATADSFDQRIRMNVLDSIGPEYTDPKEMLRESGLLLRRFNEVVQTLLAEGTIKVAQSGIDENGQPRAPGYKLSAPHVGVAGSLSAMISVEAVRLLYPGILQNVLDTRNAPDEIRAVLNAMGDPIPIYPDVNKVALVGGGDTSTYIRATITPTPNATNRSNGDPGSNGNGDNEHGPGILFDREMFTSVAEPEEDWRTLYGEDFFRGEPGDGH